MVTATGLLPRSAACADAVWLEFPAGSGLQLDQVAAGAE
jgi:hypothetical protein